MVRSPAKKTGISPASTKDEANAVRRGDIFWVDISALGVKSKAGERQPVLVVQNDTGNAFGATVIVALLTSSLSSREYPVNVIMPEGLLPKACEARLSFLVTVDRTALTERAGSLSQEKLSDVDRALRVSLGLSGS